MGIISARLVRFFAWCGAISSVIAAMFKIRIVPDSTQAIGLTLLSGVFAFVISQIFSFRIDYFVLEDREDYIISNIIAYLIFIAISMLMRPVLNIIGGFLGFADIGTVVHTWLFAIYKFGMFSNVSISWVTSSLIVHTLMIVIIVVAPIGMHGYFWQNKFGR